jgi:hypothetical protein
MRVAFGKWTDIEKREMSATADMIYEILKELQDPMKQAFVAKLVYNETTDIAAIAKIKTIDKKGKVVDLKDKINRIRSIVEGMDKSNINLVLFRDVPEVWMQYYMGKFLDRPTLLLCREEDIETLKYYKVEDDYLVIEDFYNIDGDKMKRKIDEVFKKHGNNK